MKSNIGAGFAGVEDLVGIKHLLDLPHKSVSGIAYGVFQITLLRVADGVLAGYLSSEFLALGISLIHNYLDSPLELFLGQIVAAGIYVQVAVAGMAVVTKLYADLFAHLAGKEQKFCNTVNGNDNVKLVNELCAGLDSC